MAKNEISKMREIEPSRAVRGIDKLKAWFIQHGGENAPIESIDILRTIQSLRSKSSAHRKSSELTKLLAQHGMNHSSPRNVYKSLVINPLLEYCKQLRYFAESRIG